jgi:hypothetical protein
LSPTVTLAMQPYLVNWSHRLASLRIYSTCKSSWRMFIRSTLFACIFLWLTATPLYASINNCIFFCAFLIDNFYVQCSLPLQSSFSHEKDSFTWIVGMHLLVMPDNIQLLSYQLLLFFPVLKRGEGSLNMDKYRLKS